VPCEECGGTGKLPKCKCIACEGLGFVNEEVISRKVQGQPGDAAFLNVAKEVVKEMCRLEALYKQPDVKVQHVVSGELEYAHRFDGYEGVDPEKLLAAKRALDELEMTTVDGEVVQIAEEKEVESSDG